MHFDFKFSTAVTMNQNFGGQFSYSCLESNHFVTLMNGSSNDILIVNDSKRKKANMRRG